MTTFKFTSVAVCVLVSQQLTGSLVFVSYLPSHYQSALLALSKMSQDMQATASSSAAAAAASPMPIDASSSQAVAPAVLDEGAKKDRALAEFMLMLDDYEPLVRFGCLV